MKRTFTFEIDDEEWFAYTDEERKAFSDPLVFKFALDDFGEWIRGKDKYSEETMISIEEVREKFWEIYNERI